MNKVSSFYHNYDRHKTFGSIYFFLGAEIESHILLIFGDPKIEGAGSTLTPKEKMKGTFMKSRLWYTVCLALSAVIWTGPIHAESSDGPKEIILDTHAQCQDRICGRALGGLGLRPQPSGRMLCRVQFQRRTDGGGTADPWESRLKSFLCERLGILHMTPKPERPAPGRHRGAGSVVTVTPVVGYTSLLSIGGGILIHQVIRLVTG